MLWIPSFFRTQETQTFIECWRSRFGDALPQPRIRSSGGVVQAPVSVEILVDLSDNMLFRLLRHYNANTERFETIEDRLIGGRDELQWVIREAAALNPQRFLALFPRILTENLHDDYAYAFVDGIANHLRYRFGNLQPQNAKDWKPVEPLPDGKELAVALLNLLERQPIIWKDERTFSHALAACCQVLADPDSAERLTFLLSLLSRSKSPGSEADIEKDENEMLNLALNSTRGVVADSAMILCNRLLEIEQTPPDLLPPLLARLARDPVKGVRVSLLDRLPYLMHQQPDLGWQLFNAVFQEPQSHLWTHAERCLYYQYHNNFEKVKTYLERVFQEGLEEAGETWGRIATLACLAGHIDQEQLFIFLKTANTKVQKGAAEVFGANLDRPEHTVTCHEGLLNLLQHGELTADILHAIARCFDKDSPTDPIKDELALAFVHALFAGEMHYGTYPFLEWLASRAHRDPHSALRLTETLADKLEQQAQPQGFEPVAALVATLVEILREADETDDPVMIQRAIRLQDRFLKINLYGIDTLLDDAART